ncbi:protein FAM161A [Sinocyclocheilus rhinocerous]|nr:PREDICTED: protein FAM161A-like [Sinocyclocheilus rhinocerous]
MKKSHHTNVLVMSCLKTPVDPHTKVPLAQYERERSLPALTDNMHHEKEIEYDSGSELVTDDPPAKDSNALLIKDYRVTGDHIDLREFYFSNQEYYRKLEQLKKAHLQTMAELELMYRKKLDLKGVSAADNSDRTNLSPQGRSPVITSNLKKARSALELRRTSDLSDLSEECNADNGNGNTEKGLQISPKEHIKNMWQDFSVHKLSPPQWHPFSSSLQSLPTDCQAASKLKGQRLKKHKQMVDEGWHPRVTVPKPFQMTLREAERRKKGIKSRSEMEQENVDLRRQVEELTECQRKFHASPAPAHVRLPLYEELQERDKERRRLHRDLEQQHLHTSQRPFSFLKRERLKKEQKEAKLREQMLKHDREEEERRKCPFKAKPVPRTVKEAASGEQQKEEELYRAIKMQMRARELLHGASMPPSMLARQLSEKQVHKAAQDEGQTHRPKINAEVPDFDGSYRRFRKQLAKCKEVRPVTACEPFQLRTANIASHKERIMADIEAEIKSPKPSRWPFMTPPALSPRTPSSSLCSSLSGSQECLSAKITDAAKKRQEAVRKVLEQRKREEEEEEKWKEKQKQREKRLQKVITKRAQANDPHVTLAQTCPSKLKEFRKQDLQRQREYWEEMREIQERVKGRPLLLEQVAQMNAKRAAEKLYSATLHGCGLSESFISSKAPKGLKHRQTPSPAHSGSQTPPTYRNEDNEELPDLQDSLLGDYADDYEEYDHDMEAEHMDRDEDDRHSECHDTDEEKGNDEGHSYHDKLDFDDDDEQDERYKDDDVSRKHSQSSRGSESKNSHHSDRSRTGSVN